MSLSYQEQVILHGVAARAAILNLDARYDRSYSAVDLGGWLTTFRHAGATFGVGGQDVAVLTEAFDAKRGQRLITADHDIDVDGVHATQRCVALLFVDGQVTVTGSFADKLVYERGGWYFSERRLDWDGVLRPEALPA